MVAVVIVVAAAVVLGVVLVVAAATRRENDTIGHLSRETVQRDRGARRGPPPEELPVTSGREVERRAAEERHRSELTLPGDTEVVPWTPPDPEQVGVNRRQFLNRSIVGAFAVGLSGFGAGALAFLWPQVSGGFGAKLSVGKVTDVKAEVAQAGGFFYYPEGRMWIVPYPSADLEKAKQVYSPPELAGMEAGLLALYQKCPHLGCRVPACNTSQWFECPCHGSQYNHVGEKKGGPAPRGMDRFAMSTAGGVFNVDTGNIILGPPIGTNTTGQEAEGPHCVTGAGGHH